MLWTKTATPQDFMSKRVIDALKANFNDHELIELSKLGTPVEVAAGTSLTIEGTLGQQALVLVDGTASVMRNGETFATLRGGDVVGEIALLTGEPRTATVVTDSDSLVYALSSREFSSLLSRCPRLSRRVTSGAMRRVSAIA